MVATNVELSKTELELVTSSEVILTKNRIIEKVYALFGSLSEEYRKILAEYSHNLPAEIFEKAPKIYRGENYMALPYVMLDYPRIFGKEEVAERLKAEWGLREGAVFDFSYPTKYASHSGFPVDEYIHLIRNCPSARIDVQLIVDRSDPQLQSEPGNVNCSE